MGNAWLVIDRLQPAGWWAVFMNKDSLGHTALVHSPLTFKAVFYNTTDLWTDGSAESIRLLKEFVGTWLCVVMVDLDCQLNWAEWVPVKYPLWVSLPGDFQKHIIPQPPWIHWWLLWWLRPAQSQGSLLSQTADALPALCTNAPSRQTNFRAFSRKNIFIVVFMYSHHLMFFKTTFLLWSCLFFLCVTDELFLICF